MRSTAESFSRTSTTVVGESSKSILLWALLGLVACAFSFTIFGQWVMSDTAFRSVPLTEADAISDGSLRLIRIVEVISSGVLLWALLQFLVRPWVRTGKPSIQGLLLIGALISYVLDTMVNYGGYWMAWNKHAFNVGTWASFFPGHAGPTQYAEALFWGPPMYMYFGVVLGTIQLWILDRLQSKIGFALALAASFTAAFAFDFIAESTIIRAGAYAWPLTIGSLTVWPGSLYQFPLYESLMVGIYATGYTLLLRSARTNGVSFIERGVDRLPAAIHTPMRLLAATGFATLFTFIYFAGFNVFSDYANSAVAMPAYMMYVDPAWVPPR